MSNLKEACSKYAKAKSNEEKALTNLKIVYSDTFIDNNPRAMSELCDFLHCEYIDYIVVRSFTDSNGHTTDYVLVNTNTNKYAIILSGDTPIDSSYYGHYIFDTVIVKSTDLTLDVKYCSLYRKLHEFNYNWYQLLHGNYVNTIGLMDSFNE